MFRKNRFSGFSNRGQSLGEYAIIIALVAVAVVAGLYFYRTKVSSAYKGAADRVATVNDVGATADSGSLTSASQFEQVKTDLKAFWASPRGKLILLGCAFLFLCLMYVNQYRAQKKLRRTQALSSENGENGQAMTEFVLAFPVLLLAVLIIFQWSLLYLGYFMVDYASYCAARTAIVWIGQDLNQSQQSGQGGQSGQSGQSGNKENENELRLDDSAGDDIKMAKIKNAARFACVPISPPMTLLIQQRVNEVQNAVNNFNLNTLSGLFDNFINSAMQDFGQNMMDKVTDAVTEMANPMNYLNPFGSGPSSSGSSQSADPGSPLDLSSFFSDTFKNTIESFNNIQNYFTTGLTGDVSTVMQGLESPVNPLVPEPENDFARVMLRFFDKYASSCVLTTVKILDSDLKVVETSTKTYGPTDDVIVEVRHWFHLGIPLANGIFGKKIYWWSGELHDSQYGGLSPTGFPGRYHLLVSRCIMTCEGRTSSSKTPTAWDWF